MSVGFIAITDVHYNKRDEERIKKLKEKLNYLEGKLKQYDLKFVFIDLGDVLTNPEKLYQRRGHIYVVGNHDLERFGAKFNNRKLHTEYFEFKYEGLEDKLEENGFGTDLNITNYEYKIFQLNYKQTTIYFTHLRPNKKLREKLINHAENGNVYIVYGHIHKKGGNIIEYSLNGKLVTEIRIPAFTDTKSIYFLYFSRQKYFIKKIFIG